MKIGIDLDQVLADLLPALIEFHNFTYGTVLTEKQFNSDKFWEVWGGTREEAIKKVYPIGNVKIFFTRINSHANWYIADANLFYKNEIDLQKYIKSHTKCEPITAVYCDL